MKRAMVFPIHKKMDDMIFDGTKKLHFLNKLPKHLETGMKIYFYEALGKRKKGYCVPKKNNDVMYLPCNECIAYVDGEPPYEGCSRNLKLTTNPPYEGTGMIVGEATVGEIYKIINPSKIMPVLEKSGVYFNHMPFTEHYSLESMTNGKYIEQGYIDQKVAIELTNVIKYDEEWKTEMINAIPRNMSGAYIGELSEENWYFGLRIHISPSAPIAKEEFVKYNSVSGNEKAGIKTDLDWFVKTRTCIVEHPPQAPIYVVERTS